MLLWYATSIWWAFWDGYSCKFSIIMFLNRPKYKYFDKSKHTLYFEKGSFPWHGNNQTKYRKSAHRIIKHWMVDINTGCGTSTKHTKLFSFLFNHNNPLMFDLNSYPNLLVPSGVYSIESAAVASSSSIIYMRNATLSVWPLEIT